MTMSETPQSETPQSEMPQSETPQSETSQKQKGYLFDTHALVFWHGREGVSDEFVRFFDQRQRQGAVYISSISFWEIGLLVKKGRLWLDDVHGWKNELLGNTQLRLIDPSAAEMIDSTQLPEHHKDPFDRLLIAQARHRDLLLVSRDQHMQRYEVAIFWR